MRQICIAALMILVPCAAARAEWSRVSGREIRLDGPVEREAYEEYRKVAEGGFEVVSLNSPGGFPMVALSIAEDLIDRQASVVVDGLCMSACANYLAIAGKSVSVKCNSVLGWHGSLSSPEDVRTEMLGTDVPVEVVDAYVAWLSRFKQRELEFYAKAGVDIAILTDSTLAVTGIEQQSTFTLDEVTGEYSYTKSAATWIPGVSDLRSYGINAAGECGERDYDAVRAALDKLGASSLVFTSERRFNLGRGEPVN